MASEDSVVVTAPSVDEAIILGLMRLTATRDHVDIEVLDEGSRGFLGIGAREARVRITRVSTPRQPSTPRSPAEETETGQPTSPAPTSPKPTEQPAARSTPAEAAKTPSREREQTTQTSPQPQTAQERAAEAPKGVIEAAPFPSPTSPSRQPEKAARASRPTDGLDRKRLEEIAREIAQNLLQDLDVDVRIEWVDEDRPTMWVSIEGRDADSLVGPRARNLHAVQYLFRSLIYHKLDGNYNVVVDADGFRKRRRRSLESLAESKAERAVEIGRTIRLQSMPAHERRIVHMTLRNDGRVTTESVGKGRDRAVTIIPTDRAGADHQSG